MSRKMSFKKIALSMGLDIASIIIILAVFFVFFFSPLQEQLLDANEVITKNTLLLQADDLSGQQSLRPFYISLLALLFGFFAIASLIHALFSSYSWYKALRSRVKYRDFLLRYLGWSAIWFGIGAGLFFVLLSVLTFRDLLPLPFLYDSLFILAGAVVGLFLGYIWLHSLRLLGHKSMLHTLWKKQIVFSRYLLGFFVVIGGMIAIIILGSPLVLLLGGLFWLLIVNILKFYMFRA
jgi:hypothetical protein